MRLGAKLGCHLRVITDASKYVTHCQTGVCIYDESGLELGTYSDRIGCVSSVEAEFAAATYGAVYAHWHGAVSITLITDCNAVAQAERGNFGAAAHAARAKLLDALAQFEWWEILKGTRDQVSRADQLCRGAAFQRPWWGD